MPSFFLLPKKKGFLHACLILLSSLSSRVFLQWSFGLWSLPLPNSGLGLMFGNLAQGFSVSWWKDKHNRHHAVPNVHGGPGGSLFADPDVDTMPLLAW
jgi:fatty-acid desaturase